jgi:phospholipid/cholesterol/gamma-HCH transport system permease protein
VTQVRDIGPTHLPGLPTPVGASLTGVGGMLRFFAQALGQIPNAIRLYPSEIFRYAGVLIKGSALVVLFMLFNTGFLAGLLADTQLSPLGVTNLNGAAIAVATTRGMIEVILGWVVAAKIGCGLVAELGAMRINEEVDALEVMGINPVTYLVSCRVAAVFVVIPGLIVAGFWMVYWGAFLFNTPILQSSSAGAYWRYLWLLQNINDLVFQVVWAVLTVALVVLIASYFGYTAKGGPVGVGENTAKSMLVGMTVVALLGAVVVQFFYGIDPNSPFAN